MRYLQGMHIADDESTRKKQDRVKVKGIHFLILPLGVDITPKNNGKPLSDSRIT